MIKNFAIRVSGRVHAVGFRYHTKQIAKDLGLKGIVQNVPDSTVVVEAEGEEEKLLQLLEWCRAGPEAAIVEQVEYSEGVVKHYKDFEIE